MSRLVRLFLRRLTLGQILWEKAEATVNIVLPWEHDTYFLRDCQNNYQLHKWTLTTKLPFFVNEK